MSRIKAVILKSSCQILSAIIRQTVLHRIATAEAAGMSFSQTVLYWVDADETE